MRIIGGLPDAMWRSEAFCSNIRLKNASILAINPLDWRDTNQSHAALQAMKMPAAAIREEILQMRRNFFRALHGTGACIVPKLAITKQKRTRVGRRGDFITSVSAGRLFGELLAFQFAANGWKGISDNELRTGRRTAEIVEAGAHDGKLAADILSWLQASPAKTIFGNRIRHHRTLACAGGHGSRKH